MLTGGRRKPLEGELKDGYYLEPTILFGQNNMRVFREEIFGPVLAVTTFKTMEEALSWRTIRNMVRARASGAATVIWPIRWGAHSGRRVWTNCYHAYPAHVA